MLCEKNVTIDTIFPRAIGNAVCGLKSPLSGTSGPGIASSILTMVLCRLRPDSVIFVSEKVDTYNLVSPDG